MNILAWVKLGALAILLSALGYLVYDYHSLRLYKENAKVEFSKKNTIIASKEVEISTLRKDIEYRKLLISNAQKQINEIKEQASEDKKSFTAERLAVVSKLDNGYSKGSERLTRRAAIATKEVFGEIENLSDISTIIK